MNSTLAFRTDPHRHPVSRGSSSVFGGALEVNRAFLVLGIDSAPSRYHLSATTTRPTPFATLLVKLPKCCGPTGRQWLTPVASPIAELRRIDATGSELADLIAREGPLAPEVALYVEVVGDALFILGLRSRQGSSPGAREAEKAVAAALEARRAILDCVDDDGWRPTVAAFSRTHLGIGRTDRKWLEAVSTALLGDWVDVLDAHPPGGDGTLHHLRREARAVHRQLVPLWQRKTGPGRVWMLDYRLPSGESLHELVGGSYRFEDDVLAWYPDRRDAGAVFARLKEDEQHVARAFALGGGSWAKAAAAAGLPAQVGERVMRKLRRLGLQHRQRQAVLAGVV
ncbi:hypothetical protein JHN61_04520 [Streptomyces sp. MBT67]|uniref:hypothetical protein n=1 Tax=unclassified Streptomyces TaxID=2593676 RepID=UPI00190D751D|nr:MULTISPECIES: hypothetical protein [unclassified Streptomyces]MBK3531066.1 hypothetical protein [Streptomyces sp. MBT72]MBK3535497.1 hypothetical protein [Streptomyces sp. MBT67]MBK3552930.1 hypothetical protein [Streptomyces sp. MBT61]MBK6032160.1 hypothetical protein [Streptomyces sp. MBT59]